MSFVVIKRTSEISRLSQRLTRCMITILTLTAISTLSVKVPAAAYESGFGAISIEGMVQVNGKIVRSGETLFAPSSIQTSAHSASVIDFKNLVRLRLGPGSSLTIDGSPAELSAVMSAGHLRCLVPKGTSFQLITTDSIIRIAGAETTVFEIETTECESTTVSVAEGQLKVNGGEHVLSAGDTLSTASASPPATHTKRRVGIFILGVAGGVLLAAIIGNQSEPEPAFPGGCIDLLSGQSNCR